MCTIGDLYLDNRGVHVHPQVNCILTIEGGVHVQPPISDFSLSDVTIWEKVGGVMEKCVLLVLRSRVLIWTYLEHPTGAHFLDLDKNYISHIQV
jgi:hypothetical protein